MQISDLNNLHKKIERRKKFISVIVAMKIIFLIGITVGPIVLISTCVVKTVNDQKQYNEENNTTATKELGKFIGGVVEEFKEGMEESK